MSVNEIKQALGSWDLRLKRETPQALLDALQYFGHIVLFPGEVIPEDLSDAALTSARYVGVLRVRDLSADYAIGGCGMAFWLGDEDNKGDVFESMITLTAQTFAASVTALLPPGGAVIAGTINSVAGTYTGTHQWQTPRQALDYVTETFGAEWRVTGDGKLDAGTVAQLYRTTPQTLLVRKQDGREMGLLALPGDMDLTQDVEDYTTRVVLLAEGEGPTISTGSANAAGVPYKDIRGNTVKLTRLVSESDTDATNATARAQLQLNRFQSARSAVQLSTDYYDIKGDLVVGDYLYVWDKESGFFNSANEIYWRGEPINPIALRCVELSYPIPEGWTVAYRDLNGVWYDLSQYYEPEGGSTTVVVGDFTSNLSGIGSEPIGPRVGTPDSTKPAQVVFGAYSTAAYQSAAINDLKAAVQLTWSQPLNTDGSTILDGQHYEIQYRVAQTYNYPITWNQASLFHWNQLQTWGRPLSNAADTGDNWHSIYIPFDQTVALIQELSVAVQYDFRIRAIDTAAPPNVGIWSSTLTLTTSGDVLAPSNPAAPTVAASRLAVQVVHFLGKASGGTFNLESDLSHLEVHVGGPNFFPDNATLVGRISANSSHLQAKIPVTATFPLENTTDVWVKVIAVDRTGNKSGASVAVQSSISLIDNAHISDLSVSKITAGSITSDWVVAAAIKTATVGRRVELNSLGLQAYDDAGNVTVNISADPAITGNFIAFGSTAGQTLARIDSSGNVTAKDGYFDRVFVDGLNIIDDIINRRPRGIIAWGKDATDVTGAGPGSYKGYLELAFVADPNRQYKITVNGDMESTSAATNERYTWNLVDGGANQPVLASTNIGTNAFPAILSVGTNTTITGMWFMNAPTAGVHRLLWKFQASIGTATLRGVDGPSFFFIEDMGPADLFVNAAVINDGSGTPVTPIIGDKYTYKATWWGSWYPDGTWGDGGHVGQGFTGAQAQGIWGFDYAKIQSDLATKTINALFFKMKYEAFTLGSGTAVFGTHSISSESEGSDIDITKTFPNRVQHPSWPEGATLTTDIGLTIAGELKNGTSLGIAVGRTPNSDVFFGFGSTDIPGELTFYVA